MVGIAIGIALVEMIRGAKMGISRTTWICQLPGHTQYKIAEELLKRIRQVDESISREEILDGMNGRICDIEEMISFEEIADWM